ncbi:MAG: 30S ribosomal protein S17 [Nitrospirae bacterium]|nr:30S ribosomal protein S17 [Nitrospirota bacterium]
MSAEAGIKKRRRTFIGEVISHRMNKTVVVIIERVFLHPTYKKVVRKTTKLKAHDEQNECKVGDTVKILESRPISKEKHWRVIEIIQRSQGVAPSEIQNPAALS